MFTRLLDASHSESVGPISHFDRDGCTFSIALDIVCSTAPALSAIVTYYSYYDHKGILKAACCERSPLCWEQIPTWMDLRGALD